MGTYSILVGNDINNIDNDQSWKQLLKKIITYCKAEKLIGSIENKPFPLLYEEIFLKSVKQQHHKELLLKKFIAKHVSEIKDNDIYKKIRRLKTQNIITTNYDFTLEGSIKIRNKGIIDERLYSIFRHYEINNKKYWHIHGDCNMPGSINLGFEHYGGQLQQIRNYVVSGTAYKSKKVNKEPLTMRLEKNTVNDHSWIDLFFTSDIYIFGFSLDFVETDLWWLLNYRARIKFYKQKNIQNTISYFIPEKYYKSAKAKIDLLDAIGVEVISINTKTKKEYYSEILNRLSKL